MPRTGGPSLTKSFSLVPMKVQQCLVTAIQLPPLIYSPIHPRSLLMGCSYLPLPDSFRDSSQAIISEYFHPSSSPALEFQLVSIQKKIAPFILSSTGPYTFIYGSAAFLIRWLKIRPSPPMGDPAPFLTALSSSLTDSVSLYIFSGFQLIPLFFPSYQMW